MLTYIFTACMLCSLLYYEKTKQLFGVWCTKPLVSTGFLVVALQQSTWNEAYGKVLFWGLLLCWLGDVFLMFRTKKTFLFGIVSFLVAHLCYAWVCFSRGLELSSFVCWYLVIVFFGLLFYAWLQKKISSKALSWAVLFYILVIVLMMSAAISSHMKSPSLLLLVGAIFFFLSDIFVALQRFVKEDFRNKFFGLFLYYIAQILFALLISS